MPVSYPSPKCKLCNDGGMCYSIEATSEIPCPSLDRFSFSLEMVDEVSDFIGSEHEDYGAHLAQDWGGTEEKSLNIRSVTEFIK